MNKILVIGMNPANKPKIRTSPTFKRLENWMDQIGVQYFSFCNTYDEQAEAKLSNVNFDRMSILAKDYDKIIALGGFASASLDKIKVAHFKMPHPSPRNRLLNDKAFEKRVIKECKEYVCKTV